MRDVRAVSSTGFMLGWGRAARPRFRRGVCVGISALRGSATPCRFAPPSECGRRASVDSWALPRRARAQPPKSREVRAPRGRPILLPISGGRTPTEDACRIAVVSLAEQSPNYVSTPHVPGQIASRAAPAQPGVGGAPEIVMRAFRAVRVQRQRCKVARGSGTNNGKRALSKHFCAPLCVGPSLYCGAV